MAADVRTTWKLLKPHARPHLPSFLLTFVLGWVSAMAQKSLWLLIPVVTAIMFPREAPSLQTFGSSGLAGKARAWLVGDVTAHGGDKFAALLRVALVVLGIAVVAGLAQYAFLTLSRWLALRMVVDLRQRIATHLMGLSMGYHGRRHFGDLLSRISNDVTITLNVLNLALKDLVQEPLQALSSVVFAALIAPWPTLIVAAGMIFIALPVTLLSRRVRKGSTKSVTQLGTSVQALTQMFSGIRTVKAFRAEERELAEYARINEGYVRATMKMVRALALSQASTLFLSFAGMGLIIVVIGMLAEAQFPDIAALGAFLGLVSGIYGSVKDVSKAVTFAQESVGASERIQSLLDERADIVERPGAKEVRALGSGLAFENVRFSYPGGDGNAVEQFTLAVRPGETLALVGPSGSGKSTLVDLVARFIDPDRGPRQRGRPRPARPDARLLEPHVRDGRADALPVPRHDRGEHPLRQARRDRGRGRGGRARSRDPRLHPRAAGGLPHERRRRRLAPLRRPAPAHHDRARVPEERAAACCSTRPPARSTASPRRSCRTRSSG